MTGETGLAGDEAGSGVEPPIGPRVRRAFGLLERWAPAVGSRWAIELWCTPPAVEMSLRMPPGVPPSEPVEASWSGHRIAGESWGDGPAVYLVHGWGGCRAHLGVFVKPLVEAGHRVIAFDLPSHNDSEPGDLAPGRTTIVECAEAVGAFVRAHGPAHAVVAHSLGAKAAALAVARGAKVDRLVFLAPMGDFAWYMDIFADRHGFGPRILRGLHRRLDRRLKMPLFDTDILRVAAHSRRSAAASGRARPRRPRQPVRDERADCRRLARSEFGDHPRARPAGALPHPAASPRDQCRPRFHRSCQRRTVNKDIRKSARPLRRQAQSSR